MKLMLSHTFEKNQKIPTKVLIKLDHAALTSDYVGYSRGSACLLSLLCCIVPCVPVFVLRKRTREIHNGRSDTARRIYVGSLPLSYLVLALGTVLTK